MIPRPEQVVDDVDVADAQHTQALKTFKTHPECDSTPQDGRATLNRWDAPAPLDITVCLHTTPLFLSKLKPQVSCPHLKPPGGWVRARVCMEVVGCAPMLQSS